MEQRLKEEEREANAKKAEVAASQMSVQTPADLMSIPNQAKYVHEKDWMVCLQLPSFFVRFSSIYTALYLICNILNQNLRMHQLKRRHLDLYEVYHTSQ